MADFNLGSIGSLLSGNGGVASIAKRAKVKQEDVRKVLSAGVPAMIAGMKKNVSNKAGEASLSKALGDHSISDLSNLSEFLKLSDLKDGKKILGHVFGDKQDAAVDKIADASGVTPTYVGDLPEVCAAMNRTNINVQLLTIQAAVTRKKDSIYQAAMMDPHCQSELSIDDIVAMCDDLIEAHKGWLPEYR